MNSSWLVESIAVFRKEWLSEMRSRHGLFTSFLFSLLSVVAMSLASFGQKPAPNLAAGMLCVTLLFSAVVSLPRSFLVEDEQGTFDLLRLAAEPTAAYAGKLIYNVVQSLLAVFVLTFLFVILTRVSVPDPFMLTVGVLFTAFALAGGVSLCGALVMGAMNRWLLGSAVALPVLMPQVFLGMGALRSALGGGTAPEGWQCVLGLLGWSVTLIASGPLLAAAAWKTDE